MSPRSELLRRKNGGMLGGRRCSSLAATALVCVALMASTRSLLLRGHQVTHGDTHGDADYLYKVEGAQPIIEEEAGSAHNLQFKRSQNPRVVEFYDPTCGACQSFRWNYIEIAKKVRYELAFDTDIKALPGRSRRTDISLSMPQP